MFENLRRGRQARNFTTNVPKILVLKSSFEQIFSRKLPLGAPDNIFRFQSIKLNSGFQSPAFRILPKKFPWFQILQAKTFPGRESRLPYVGINCSFDIFVLNTEHTFHWACSFSSFQQGWQASLPYLSPQKKIVNPFNPKCSQAYSRHCTL